MTENIPDSYTFKHIEKRVGQLFQELHGEGNLAGITFNLSDGKHVSFHREQRWLMSPHEFGVEVRWHAEGIIIMYSSIVSIHLQFGADRQAGGRTL